MSLTFSSFFFFFNDPATTEIYTLSLHDALPISFLKIQFDIARWCCTTTVLNGSSHCPPIDSVSRSNISSSTRKRSEEHTSELQSHSDLVCRLLLEKKKNKKKRQTHKKIKSMNKE